MASLDDFLAWTCPECGVTSLREAWEDGDWEVECEDCGSHSACRCPNQECHELFDHVWGQKRVLEVTEARAIVSAQGGEAGK